MTSPGRTQLCSECISSILNAPERRLPNGKDKMNSEPGTTAGAAVTITSGLISFLTAAIPVLQVIALLVSIVVGVMTSITWIQKRRRK